MNNKKLYICAGICVAVIVLLLALYYRLNTNDKKIISKDKFVNLRQNINAPEFDRGYLSLPYGFFDAQGQGELNDYCRHAGDGTGSPNNGFYCALAGDTSQYSTQEFNAGFNNLSTALTTDYTLQNPNNNRYINLNTVYAVNVYNKLNGTTYS
jgi:hypothetical protein